MLDFLESVLRGALKGAVVGAAIGLVVALAMTVLRPRRVCPECQGPLPKFRNNWRPLKCVWVCSGCGCRIDAKGNRIEA
jgi:hypothetical protein